MDNIKLVMSTFFDGVWNMFTSVTVPGFGVKLSVVAIGFFLIRLSLHAISLLTGFNSSATYAANNFHTTAERYTHYRKIYDSKTRDI